MTEINFLKVLTREGKLEEVEPSEEIKNSYVSKSKDCLKSAKLLFSNALYENSVSMSYYAMYNSLLALLFKIGIKSENHTGSIILLKLVFEREDLFEIISDAKKERIDKQYYVETEKSNLTKDSAKDLFEKAEEFVLEIGLIAEEMGREKTEKMRDKLGNLLRN